MPSKAVITILGPLEKVREAWEKSPHREGAVESVEPAVTFRPAPGDRGTEIHVDLEPGAPGGKLGEMALKVTGKEPLAKAKDELRRFKAIYETGVLPVSEGSPQGELAERKLKQRPAQPLEAAELEEVRA
jgi:uncharacterized membrane protein